MSEFIEGVFSSGLILNGHFTSKWVVNGGRLLDTIIRGSYLGVLHNAFASQNIFEDKNKGMLA